MPACFILLLAVFLVHLPVSRSSAQPIPAGSAGEEQYRLLQLRADTLIGSSFVNLPLWRHSYDRAFGESGARCPEGPRFFGESLPAGYRWWECPLRSSGFEITGGIRGGFYDPLFTNTLNSSLPYGENNGAAWYGKGLNSELQGGLWLTSDWLTLTFRPHLVWQQNLNFQKPRFIGNTPGANPDYGAEVAYIDRPWRFGGDSFSTADLGQSSLRLHYRNLEAGLSNETLWWGPAVRYPLTLSNNAPGLKHVFLGTRGPMRLPLGAGSVEFRWIWSWPEDSGYFTQRGSDKDRFMNGINFSYSPSFLPGLTVGFSRIFQTYIPEGGLDPGDYWIVLQPFQKVELDPTLGEERDDDTNQMASVYLRWLLPESDLEVYGEYYRDDHNWDLRDFLMEPDNQRAYTLGMQKLVDSGIGPVDFFRVNAEINNLVPSRVDEVRPQLYFYTHDPIRQGHTNRGQVLGAAIGPGSGSQYLSVDAFLPRGQAGLFLQRVEHNDFFHYEYYDQPHTGIQYKDIWRNWIALNVGLRGRWQAGPLLLSGSLVWNKHFNYGRFNYGDLDVSYDTFEGFDIVNWQLRLAVQYYLDFE